ncbi:MAG: YraN family protein [Clostridia bacterium]|nr:YraN family protein [Clostridia bacterium]
MIADPTGNAGEEAAMEAYRLEGYEIVTRNYHSRYGEIDFIARRDNLLVFVEVKTRTPQSRYTGVAAMTRTKKRRIFKTALVYLKAHGTTMRRRFDVVDISGHWAVFDQKEIFIVDHLRVFKGAFGSEVYDGFI